MRRYSLGLLFIVTLALTGIEAAYGQFIVISGPTPQKVATDVPNQPAPSVTYTCLLYTSDAAD
ncbi:MAG: hypothetical protein N3B12_09425, partial [Armatimonadetes bacterium]|nr:hypothetical protein [Armatimonadota bacterium]